MVCLQYITRRDHTIRRGQKTSRYNSERVLLFCIKASPWYFHIIFIQVEEEGSLLLEPRVSGASWKAPKSIATPLRMTMNRRVTVLMLLVWNRR